MENSELQSDICFTDLPPKKKAGLIIRDVIFLVLLIGLVRFLSLTFDIKGIENENYSAVSTAAGFYDCREDSLDVLFLGSSNAYCAFDPAELQKASGLSSYNLASSQQSMLSSCTWLEEALRSQHPKAVVLDAYYLFFPMGNEGSVRKALDWMHWSGAKYRAVHALANYDSTTYTAGSFLFPILRYHERWKEMTAGEVFGDTSFAALSQKTSYLGYCPRDEVMGACGFTPLAADGSVPYTSLDTENGQPTSPMLTGDIPEMSTLYFARMASICEKEGIRLILVKTPILWWSQKMHDGAAALAREYGVPFYDLNEASAIDAMNFSYETDAADHLHANRTGAAKITDYIGQILSGEGIEND